MSTNHESTAIKDYADDRSVLVRIKATPDGLRRMANILEQQGPGKSIRINWYSSQIEFVFCTDVSRCAVSG